MKKAKAGRVPVLESAFEIKLPWLMKQAKVMSTNTLVITDGDIRTVVELTPTRLATKLGGVVWIVDIVPVPCLGGRVRPLLKCPRAHEGNFQALYFRSGELACRHCHALRYRTNIAATAVERARLARTKLLCSLGAEPGCTDVVRQPYKWRKKHIRLVATVAHFTSICYQDIRAWLKRNR